MLFEEPQDIRPVGVEAYGPATLEKWLNKKDCFLTAQIMRWMIQPPYNMIFKQKMGKKGASQPQK